MAKAELERLRIDVVDELHEIRRRHARMPSEEIEKAAAWGAVQRKGYARGST